jgi:hypothetical protein
VSIIDDIDAVEAALAANTLDDELLSGAHGGDAGAIRARLSVAVRRHHEGMSLLLAHEVYIRTTALALAERANKMLSVKS